MVDASRSGAPVRSATMDAAMRDRIVGLLDSHPVMTIATLRPDGWPQATVVGYVN